jgi:hypothetical protein
MSSGLAKVNRQQLPQLKAGITQLGAVDLDVARKPVEPAEGNSETRVCKTSGANVRSLLACPTQLRVPGDTFRNAVIHSLSTL